MSVVELANMLRIDEVVNPTDEHGFEALKVQTQGYGIEVAIDCSGWE